MESRVPIEPMVRRNMRALPLLIVACLWLQGPSDAFACLWAKREIHQAIGVARGGDSLWYLVAGIRRAGRGCVSHRFEAVRYSWDLEELERRPVFETGIPGVQSVRNGEPCEAELARPGRFVDAGVIVGKARRVAPFKGLAPLGGPLRRAPVSVAWPRADGAREAAHEEIDPDDSKTPVAVTLKRGGRVVLGAPPGFERRPNQLLWIRRIKRSSRTARTASP